MSGQGQWPIAHLQVLILEDSEWRNYGILQGPYAAYHYLCPRCGLVWAGFWPLNPEAPVRHMATHANCAAHGGGSLRLWNEAPLEHLPWPALARELGLLIHHGENYEFINHRNPFNHPSTSPREQHPAHRGNGHRQDLLPPHPTRCGH